MCSQSAARYRSYNETSFHVRFLCAASRLHDIGGVIMTTQLRFFGILLALAAFALIACGGGVEIYEVGTEANMTGLTIGTVRINAVPEPIDSFNWDEEDFDLLGAPVAVAPLERSSDTVAARFKPIVSKGARVLWGIGSQDMRPFSFNDLRVPATFEDADYVYFKITSEDGEISNYYRFAIFVRSPVVELSNVYIGRYETHPETNAQGGTTIVVDVDERMMATLEPGNPNLQTAIANTTPGVLSIMANQAQAAEIKVTPYDSNATIKYAVVATSSVAPVFGTSNTFNLTDYTYLYIQVTAQNTVDVAYYKFRIEVGRIATIKTLTFVGNAGAEFDVANTGNQRSSWNAVANGNFKTADMPSDGFGIAYVLNDPASTVSWELTSKGASSAPASFTSLAKVIFDGTNILALKVVSQNGQATRYYKIEVELLAAAFTQQPKSDYYYYYAGDNTPGNTNPTAWVGGVDGAPKIYWYDYAKLTGDNAVNSTHPNFTSKGTAQVEPLTFELDRLGTFTYQWYEANSWYGGYGFDADGRILYYEQGDPTAKAETGFVADSYHIKGFDEKKNVSFHNGGNQYYRLPTKGRMIPGASGTYTDPITSSYTPRIDYRPFIDGFTSETHYYWVEVRDAAGRTAVSKRAAIVSERDPRKRHHIVDLNNDLYRGDPANPSETGTARNPKVFTVKRETYKIPVSFPDAWDGQPFDVNDYTVATVQALFWLKDGTPWIQNWTQGDIGFEADDGERLIYYNLTNNNGTLGLVGGGKEPGGGSLTKTPAYLIVKPAGEKPVTELPPFEADGVTPKPNNDAQGWFCGFIELVEVRFEGPAR